MRNSIQIGTSLFILIILAMSGITLDLHHGFLKLSDAQTAPSVAPSFIELGYGPEALTPASDGIPIYAPNDDLWLLSNFDQWIAITLTSPVGTQEYSANFPPSTSSLLYKFLSTDPAGNWSLVITLQNSTSYQLVVSLVNIEQSPANARLAQYSIQGGQINLGFSVQSAGSYDMEGCLTSNSPNDTITVQEPSNLGGNLVIINIPPNSTTSSVRTVGTLNQQFSFWFEADYLFGFSGEASNEILSRYLVAERSDTAVFTNSTAQTVNLNDQVSLRTGRYQIRAYFESVSGLTVETTRALLQSNGDWYSLNSCNPFTITKMTFTQQISLNQDPDTWPTRLFFLYTLSGVDTYSAVPLQINLAKVDFFGEPGNVRLSYLNYQVANSSQIEASGTYSGSVYVIAKSYPATVMITPTLGETSLSTQTVQIPAPDTDSRVSIPVGILSVRVVNNSNPDAGAIVNVENVYGFGTSANIGPSGNATFYLPSGSYNVTAVKGKTTSSQNVTLVEGSAAYAEFSFSSSPILPSYVLELLILPLAVGILLNVWIWVVRSRKSNYR